MLKIKTTPTAYVIIEDGMGNRVEELASFSKEPWGALCAKLSQSVWEVLDLIDEFEAITKRKKTVFEKEVRMMEKIKKIKDYLKDSTAIAE